MEQPSIDGTREEWLVYGDSLQQQGDPRGELIVLNDKVASGEDAAGRNRYLKKHATESLGAVGSNLDSYRLTWAFGLIAHADVLVKDGEDGAALANNLLAAPITASLKSLGLVGIQKR